jgi:hypothetical protein
MASSDVRAKRVTGTGSISVGPARIRAIHALTTGTNGRLTITNGSGGETLLDIDLIASDSTPLNLPDNGIRAEDVYISAFTNLVAVTVMYS